MHLAGVFSAASGGHHVVFSGNGASPSTVSNLNKKIYAKIEAWRSRRIEGRVTSVLDLQGIVMKRSWAVGAHYLQPRRWPWPSILKDFERFSPYCEGARVFYPAGCGFLRHLVDRGLKGATQLIISDACRGLMEPAAE